MISLIASASSGPFIHSHCERCVYIVVNRAAWPCILPLPLTSYVTLGKLLNLCGPQFPHLLNGDYNRLPHKSVRTK